MMLLSSRAAGGRKRGMKEGRKEGECSVGSWNIRTDIWSKLFSWGKINIIGSERSGSKQGMKQC